MAATSDRPALRVLAGIANVQVRVGAVAKRACRRPEAFVAELESLVLAAGLGGTADADALLACVLWLLGQGDARVPELHALALREGHALVAAMLTDAAPHRGLAPRGRLPELGVPETARVVRHVFAQSDCSYVLDGIHYESWTRLRPNFATLVERAGDAPFMWRPIHPRSVRRAVTQLGKHHSAFTIGRLLDDPATRERDVIAIAARRPITPAIVRQLTSHLRWAMLPNVRATLVANPCTPTRVALLLAATCLPRLRGIAATNVHPRVRDLARLVRM